MWKKIKEGNTFCTNCGKPIENISENTAPKEKKPKKKFVIISIFVLVVIGIIITGVIAVPKVIHQIEEKRYQAEMQQDLDSIDITLKEQEIILPSQGTYNQNLYEVVYPELIEKPNDYAKYEQLVDNYKGGKLKITGNVDIGIIGEYEIIYTVTSEKGNTKAAKLNVKVQDYMRPEIYVKDDTIQITEGTNVNILDGVTAEDNIDDSKELTSRIITEGTVDVNKIGEYTITYKVKDTAGWSCEKTRTYKVIEKQKNIRIGVVYRYRVYNENYTNGYVDSEITFLNGNNIQVDGMDKIVYEGKYTLNNDTITANVKSVSDDPEWDILTENLKLEIQDENTIKNLSSGYVYKAK